jgi:hypothetical protein
MNINELQIADALFLIGIVGCSMIILQRDFKHASIFLRAAVVVFMISAWGQAMWLLGVWQPTDAGFPWPRVTFDGTLFLTSSGRVLWSEKSRLRHFESVISARLKKGL